MRIARRNSREQDSAEGENQVSNLSATHMYFQSNPNQTGDRQDGKFDRRDHEGA